MHVQTRATHFGTRMLVATASSLLLAIAASSATDTNVGTPSTAWNQALVTQAAGLFAEQMKGLYETAIKEPAFAGERTANSETLDNLRVLGEESRSLHAQLEDGKTREQTLHTWQRIKELQRDALESSSWEFVPTDFSTSAQAALRSTDQLDGFYGVK